MDFKRDRVLPPADVEKRYTGIVISYDPRKGHSCGWIRPDDYSSLPDDVFVSYVEIDYDGYKMLVVGDKVGFNVIMRKQRYYALRVNLIRS